MNYDYRCGGVESQAIQTFVYVITGIKSLFKP